MANNNQKAPQMKMGGRGGRGQYKPVEKPKDFKKTAKRLFKYIVDFKKYLIPIIVLILIYTTCNLLSTIYVKKIATSFGTYVTDTNGIGKWAVNPDYEAFISSLIIWIVLFVLYALFRYFGDLLSAYLSSSLTRKLRKDLFGKIVKLPIGYTDSHKHGDIMSRITNDVDTVTTSISSSLSSLIGGILTIIGYLCLMIYYSPVLCLVSLGVLALTVLLTSLISKFMAPLAKKQYGILGQLNSDAEEMISGSKTVIAYNRQQIAKDSFKAKSKEMCKLGIKAQIIGGSMGPCMNFVGNVGYFLVCVIGTMLAVNGNLISLSGAVTNVNEQIGIVILFLTSVKQFNRPISEIAEQITTLVNAVAASERIFDLLDTKEEDFESKVNIDINTIKGDIDFKHIGFSYEEGKPVLTDFNVDIRSGHKIALVGATGSGKTTIVNLLLRFYDINSGSICIDGIDIKDMSKETLRDMISIVLQDPILFQDSVENNVKYGHWNSTDEDVDKALEFANCKKFVDKLADGKKTILTEGATNISQGQRQLLTIARAVIGNPKILILDEATSSVDTRTEKKIQDAMVKLMQNRTSIIIAHRLSTIQDADLIIVLDKGKIAEMGNHKELLNIDGVYKKLYMSQFAGNEI